MGGRLFEEPGADEYAGLDLRSLAIDHAWLVITSGVKEHAWLYARSDDCHRCAYKVMADVAPGSNASIVMDGKHAWSFRLRSDNSSANVPDHPDEGALCQVHGSMGEFGVYDIHLTNDANNRTHCHWSTLKEPVDIYMPLVACFVFYACLAIVWIGLKAAYRRGAFDWALDLAGFGKYAATMTGAKRGSDASQVLGNVTASNAPESKKKRLKSLDTFRGISIVVMIFVNDGGGLYWFFDHATWNGLLVADLVFPWFMWIMGVCMPMSLRSSLRRRETRLRIFLDILRRSCSLFLLGLVNNSLGANIDVHRLRIPGVLQRFAITYLAVGVTALVLTRDAKQLDSPPPTCGRLRRSVHDVLALWPQWIVMLSLVGVHCLVTFLLPLEPGCPTGYAGPGGLHLDARYPANCIGGAAGYIDRWLLGVDHIYNWPTARHVYQSGPYDPEGVLGSLLSTFQVFLGYQAGVTLLVYPKVKSRVVRWLSWAIVTGAIGTVLCLASQEDGWIPVNKNLWSLSYVMVTSCFAFVLLTVCYLLIDVKRWWTGAPFFYPGMNGILMYLGHQGAYALFPWHWVSGPMNTHFERLVETLWGVSLWVAIAAWLHHKKIFLAL